GFHFVFTVVQRVDRTRRAVDCHSERRVSPIFHPGDDRHLFSDALPDDLCHPSGQTILGAMASYFLRRVSRRGLRDSIQRTVSASTLFDWYFGSRPLRAASWQANHLVRIVSWFLRPYRRTLAGRELEPPRLAVLQHELSEHRDGVLS